MKGVKHEKIEWINTKKLPKFETWKKRKGRVDYVKYEKINSNHRVTVSLEGGTYDTWYWLTKQFIWPQSGRILYKGNSSKKALSEAIKYMKLH